MLFFAHKTDYEGLTAATDAYHANIGKAEPICGLVNNQTAGFVNGLCSYDRDEVRRLAARKTVEHTLHGSDWMSEGWPGGQPSPSYPHLGTGDIAMIRAPVQCDPAAVEEFMVNEGFVMAGSPDDCARVLDGFKSSGVDKVIIHMQMGGIPHDRIMESIELMAEELIPNYR